MGRTTLPSRPRRVLSTLAENTVKFAEHGGVSLRAHWADGRTRFDVQDSGPGIAPDEIKQILESFVQAEAGRQAKEGSQLHGLDRGFGVALHLPGMFSAQSRGPALKQAPRSAISGPFR